MISPWETADHNLAADSRALFFESIHVWVTLLDTGKPSDFKAHVLTGGVHVGYRLWASRGAAQMEKMLGSLKGKIA